MHRVIWCGFELRIAVDEGKQALYTTGSHPLGLSNVFCHRIFETPTASIDLPSGYIRCSGTCSSGFSGLHR